MTTSATKIENSAYGRFPLRWGRRWYRGFAKKAVVLAVLVMIAALPVTACISATDNTRSLGAASVHLGRYHLAAYSLSHLPHTIEGYFETRMKHQRKRFFAVRTFDYEFSEGTQRPALRT
jgi:hypothetical protein